MLEHSIYSVISPEGCASILWKNADKMREAAAALRLTAQDLLELGVADTVVPEPLGGAHRDRAAAISSVSEAIQAALTSLNGLSPVQLRGERRQKFIGIGAKGLS
jgi:acetyl-CoA carboxylase carboxyl transferase subunit alpha